MSRLGHYSELLDGYSGPAVVMDIPGNVVWASRSLLQLTGWESVALYQQTYKQLLHPDDQQLHAFEEGRLLGGEVSAFHVGERLAMPDGDHLSVSCSGGLLSGPEGPDGLLLLLSELDARQHSTALLASSEERYRVLSDTLRDTVTCVYAKDFRITAAAGPLETRGFDRAELIGARPEDLLEPYAANALRNLLAAAFAGHRASGEVTNSVSGVTSAVDVVLLPHSALGAFNEAMVVSVDVRPEKERKRLAATTEARWRATFDEAPVGMLELDPDGRILQANRAIGRLAGVPSGQLLGQRVLDVVHPDERADAEARRLQLTDGKKIRTPVIRRITTGAGEIRWVTVRGALIKGEDSPDRVLLHVTDVTADVTAKEQLQTLSRFSALLSHGFDTITISSPDGEVIYANPAIESLIGLPPEAVVGQNLSRFFHPEDLGRVREFLMGLLQADGTAGRFECRVRHVTDGWRYVEVNGSNQLADPAIRGIVSNGRDITERVQAAERLAHQAMHDALTDLPNRALFLDRLGQALARAVRSGRLCAVFFLDLDRFKQINDTLGHAAGDFVLTTVAERLSALVRPSDSVGRLGGDEFVILAENIDDHLTAMAIAERVRLAVSEPLVVGGRTLTTSCSVGIALSNQVSPEAVLQEADMALYHAKDSGRNRWEI